MINRQDRIITHVGEHRVMEKSGLINENLGDNISNVPKQESPKMLELNKILDSLKHPLNLKTLLFWLKKNTLEMGMVSKISAKMVELIKKLNTITMVYTADIFYLFLAMKQLESPITLNQFEQAKLIKSYVNACCYLSDDLIMAESDKTFLTRLIDSKLKQSPINSVNPRNTQLLEREFNKLLKLTIKEHLEGECPEIKYYYISTLLNPDQNKTISNTIYRGDTYLTETLIPTKLKPLINLIENMQADEYSNEEFKNVVIKLISIHTLNYLGFSHTESKLNQKEEKINKKLDLDQLLNPLLIGLSQAQIGYLPIALNQILK